MFRITREGKSEERAAEIEKEHNAILNDYEKLEPI